MVVVGAEAEEGRAVPGGKIYLELRERWKRGEVAVAVALLSLSVVWAMGGRVAAAFPFGGGDERTRGTGKRPLEIRVLEAGWAGPNRYGCFEIHAATAAKLVGLRARFGRVSREL